MNGILLLDKPAGVTSFEALDLLKKRFRLKKIGHGGTIDKFATGLLIAGINEGTKLLNYYMSSDKAYEAVFELGRRTDTLDVTGEVDFTFDGVLPGRDGIEAAMRQFVGAIDQLPPTYSAIKVKGKRASDRARGGEDVELLPRRVTIYSFRALSYEQPFLSVSIECAKGTYVRSLARDLGEALGCGAYVKSLRRTIVSPFSVDKAQPLDALLSAGSISPWVIPLAESLPFLPTVVIDDVQRNLINKGQPVKLRDRIDSPFAAAVHQGRLVAVLALAGAGDEVHARPDRILFDR